MNLVTAVDRSMRSCSTALLLAARAISRLPIVVVADHKWNDEPLRENGGSRTPISPRFAVFRVFVIFERPWEKKLKS